MGKKVIRCITKVFLIVVVTLFFCEYAIYPLVLYKCSWPAIKPEKEMVSKDESLKAMFIADTHLLGPFRGHWFDKLRREWQMHRAFQTAVASFKPEVVFFLGDLFDEGEWVQMKQFHEYVQRFESLFSVPKEVQIFVVAGNHDMGFHYKTCPVRNSRFRDAFNTSSVRLLNLKGVSFLLINSMAMEMDGCFLCNEAMLELNEIEDILGCQKDAQRCLKLKKETKEKYPGSYEGDPIILQHFPLYRPSDKMCTGEDSAPKEEKSIAFRQNIDCLSQESSKMLLHSIKPRLIMSGHTHHYCLMKHHFDERQILEYSVPSFSWRNRNDPSFFLGIFSKEEYHLSKCYMPKENTVQIIYFVAFCAIFVALVFPLILKFWKFMNERLSPQKVHVK